MSLWIYPNNSKGKDRCKKQDSFEEKFYSFVEHFLFFALHIDILNLSFGKSDEYMKNIATGILCDIMTCGLMILFVYSMINWFTKIQLEKSCTCSNDRFVKHNSSTCVASENS